MSAAMQKEVEKHFTRGEFRRVAAGEVGSISYPARVRETYAAELLSTIDADAVRERRFRIVVDYGFSGASYVLPLVLGPLGVEVVAAHAFTGEGPDYADAAPGLAASIGQTKRLVPVGRRRSRRRLRPLGRAAPPRRRAGARGAGRAGAAALPPPARLERPPRQARLPGDRDEPGRPARRGLAARGRAHADLAAGADARRGRGRRRLRGRRGRRLRLPRVPARLRRGREPREAARAARARQPAAVGARGRAAASRRSSTTRCPARGR